MDGVFQVEMRGEGGQVVGVVVHVMAVGGLRGAAVAAAVMGDDAIALLEEEQHLVVPVVGGERPAVAEDDGLAGTPVLVEDLDAVFGGDGGHVDSFEKSELMPRLKHSRTVQRRCYTAC